MLMISTKEQKERVVEGVMKRCAIKGKTEVEDVQKEEEYAQKKWGKRNMKQEKGMLSL